MQGIVIIGKHHKESVGDMRSKRTSVINLGECAICGNDIYEHKNGKIENVITKRNTIVRFNSECYKEMLRKQRDGGNNK